MSAVLHAVEGPGCDAELEAPANAERSTTGTPAGVRGAAACLGVALLRS
ncbi:hypothetical protein [Geodermatophilus obscurus]|uniref:Uncharacterized protein n=1 Tax=Geodermatophilus obscurus (strain ATCC 25078 / DSM 43160 / JCM 3152 / CCUG 61914 / KCC A-0152 / KCTC 9177 / NBRC 13315 / NRRL B-3577 / G-20) TaxID=526225 RepID=D2SFR0_GEOOG|nr:hypothetical protein [Geodermatophilus obscurus]ADB74815.1 hypothetical protein Gobs_2131 [Geodermatophilus obscurus DSM 43160]